MSTLSDAHVAHVRLQSKKDGAWFVDPDMRPKMVADARDQHTNMSEVALAILHRHFELPYAPSGRATDPRPDEGTMRLRLPLPLYTALVQKYGVKYVDAIRAILCAHYGLRVPAKPHRGRASATRPAAA